MRTPRLGLPANSPIVARLNGGLLPIAAHLLLFPPSRRSRRCCGYGRRAMAGSSSTSRLISWPSRASLTPPISPCATANTLPQPSGLRQPPGRHIARRASSTCFWRSTSAGYSFIPHGPIWLLVPGGLLLPIWFVLVGRRLANRFGTPALNPGVVDSLLRLSALKLLALTRALPGDASIGEIDLVGDRQADCHVPGLKQVLLPIRLP